MSATGFRVLRVRRFDPPWRWQVQSETDAERPHLVDIESFDGNGECSCRHFVCRFGPLLKAGAKASPATRCKHIRAAREALLNSLVREAKQQRKVTT